MMRLNKNSKHKMMRVLPAVLLLSLWSPASAADGLQETRDAAGLVCFELAQGVPMQTSPGGVSVKQMAGLDGKMAKIIESLEVVEIKPYFRRPARAPASAAEERLSRIFRLEYTSNAAPAGAAALLMESPVVLAASSIPIRVLAGLPDDPRFHEQWGYRQNSDFDMDLPEAWDVTMGDGSMVVAVLDTGLDRVHPDMGGFSAESNGNVWFNEAEAQGVEAVDDDENGFVDDVWGWDFVHYTDASPPPYPGEDGVDEDPDPSDFHGHGTGVAGVVGAIGNNGEGISGFLWRCKVMGIRCGVTLKAGAHRAGVVRMDWCAGAVAYATDMGAGVINASWESGYDVGLEAAVDYAISKGVVVSVAAGNMGRDPSSLELRNYLSSRGDCIDVAAVQKNGLKKPDSNFGSWVDLNAPGSAILTLKYLPPEFRGYGLWSGTSFAAPAVAAAAALVKHDYPDWTAEQVREHLQATSVPLSPPDTTIGAGTLNAFGAIRSPDGGWSVRTGGALSTAVLPASSWSGTHAIAAGLSDGRAVAWNVRGEPLSSWPLALGELPLTGIAAGNCDGDQKPEVVYVDAGGRVSVVELDGRVSYSWESGSPPVGAPALGDLNGDGGAEIVLCTSDSTVHAWSCSGAGLPGWPVRLNSHLVGGPAVGDVNGADGAEVVVACGDGAVHSLSSAGVDMPGWPVDAGVPVEAPPSLADVAGADGIPEVVLVSSGGELFVWEEDGEVPEGWPYQTGWTAGTAGVSLADIDGDGTDEAGLVSGGSPSVFDMRGFLEGGWPAGAALNGAAVLIADVTGDSLPEILAPGAAGVNAWTLNGSDITNWPKPTDGTPLGAVAIGDYDGDARPEILAGTAGGWLHCWDLEEVGYVHTALLWPLPGRTAGNTRVAALTLPTHVPEGGQGLGPGTLFRVAALWAAPNPFVSGTTIVSELSGQEGSRGSAEIRIYDAAGRLVRAIRPGPRAPGVYRDRWNGDTDTGRRAPSGVYLCVASVGKSSKSCALILIR